jgi:hypothetical protein
VTLSYDKASGTLTGFPAGAAVTMKVNGTTTTHIRPAPRAVQGRRQLQLRRHERDDERRAGQDGDTFTIALNTGSGDTRNASLLGDLQSKNILDGGSATYQSAYAHLVSAIGNKTAKCKVNAAASAAMLEQAQSAANNVSGVNLDEEAANLLKYQQAYQAAGKVMQIANTIFDTLLSIGPISVPESNHDPAHQHRLDLRDRHHPAQHAAEPDGQDPDAAVDQQAHPDRGRRSDRLGARARGDAVAVDEHPVRDQPQQREVLAVAGGNALRA